MGQLVSDVKTILDYRDSKQAAENERQKILSEMADDEREKTNLVKKALAAQRAKYGASGASPSMSTGAVLQRLKSETAAPYEERRRTNSQKLKQTQAKRPNLLQTLLDKFDDLVG
ncbi:MAG: hypothetical protein IAC69_03510 [Proteobacteria bacterium]|uniref:Uncharacterized protein n=1 Tax=Candidatus Enterousia avistercoris TaxID=2840788 RepID=A0A9D9DEZ8_9PROT|nr:hypothetical protein [Candidatus Enterousia avistercoris]